MQPDTISSIICFQCFKVVKNLFKLDFKTLNFKTFTPIFASFILRYALDDDE